MSYTVTLPHPTRDRDAILDLWRTNLPMATEQRYGWLYENGPAKNWLAASDDGSPVGSTGLMARDLRLGNRRVRVGQAIDLNIKPEHRSIGPALKLQRALIDSLLADGIPLVYAVPSPNADPIMRRMGYRLLGTQERWVKPLRSEYKLREKFKLGPLARLPALAVDLALKLRSPETWSRLPKDSAVETPSQFDDRWDRLWDRSAAQFGVVGERKSDYLTWRYLRCPDVPYRILALTGPDSELRGYAVHYTDHEGFACLSDLFFADDCALHDLLAAFIRLSRRERANAIDITYFGSARVTAALGHFGFSSRPTVRKLYVYVSPTASDSETARCMDRENWFFTKADSDTDV